MKEITLRALFRDTDAYAGQEVLIKGWVRNNRNSNKFGFIELNDGTFFKSVQVVYEEAFLDNYEEIAKSYVGSALAVIGVSIIAASSAAATPFVCLIFLFSSVITNILICSQTRAHPPPSPRRRSKAN